MEEQKNLDEYKEIKGGNIFIFDKKGDFIEGKLIDVRTGQGKFESMVYDIEQENKELAAVFGSTVLDGKMKRVSKGETVKIVFNGTITSKGGRAYADFSVFSKPEKQESEQKKE